MSEKEGIIQRGLRLASRVEPHETRATLLAFMFVFTLMAAYYILRPIRDAMSSDWTDAELSTLFTGTFIFSLAAVVIYGAACSKVSFRRLVPGVYGFFAASFLVFFLATRTGHDPTWIRKFFFIWVSVFSLFHISVFWSYMADVFSREQAQRLFGFIASGASIGAIAGPAIAVLLVGAVGPENLVVLSALMLLVPIAIIHLLGADTNEGNVASAAAQRWQAIGGNPFAGFSLFFKSPYLLGIGLFILLYTAISTFVYFELKNLMAGLDETMRVQIWGGMDLAVNVLAIATAIFATGRITSRFGLTVTLVLVPLVIVLGLLILALTPVTMVVVGLQIVRRAGNYAITRPGREMLFTVVDRETRFKAKSVIDIVVYRGGDAMTAWAFTGLTVGLGMSLGAVAGVGAGIAALWAAVAVFLGRRYDRANGAQRARTAVSEPATPARAE